MRESEKERFKSLVKLWDSSRSSYATVRHTHTHTYTCNAMLNMRHKDPVRSSPGPSDMMHTSRAATAAKAHDHVEKEFTALRAAGLKVRL